MPNPPDSDRLVPKHGDPEDVYNLSQNHEWEPTENFGEELQQWTLPDADAKVTWFPDRTTGIMHFVVEGSGRETAVKQIEDAIDILHPKDFKAYVDSVDGMGRQALRHTLYAVGLAAPEQADDATVKLLEGYLGHEDPLTRRAALIAAGLTGWQQFIKPVEAMRDDPDAEVREDVEPALRALRKAA
jgi:hypothetical protein